jgi:hypothetical protein
MSDTQIPGGIEKIEMAVAGPSDEVQWLNLETFELKPAEDLDQTSVGQLPNLEQIQALLQSTP